MILASKSPRRKEILENFGFKLEIISPDIEEISDKVEITENIKEIAEKKAMEIGKDNPDKYIIAADTVVVYKDKVLGKPKDIRDAKEMLKVLSGRVHQVITAYCILNIEKRINILSYDLTEVKFKALDDSTIEWYISTEEPMDKAGAYGIQGKGAILVEEIKGDFFSVMGLPISKIVDELIETGLKIEELSSI